MEGAEHPQRHLVITHQHGAEIGRFAQHLQRAGIAALRIPVAVQNGHRLQAVALQSLQPAFQPEFGRDGAVRPRQQRDLPMPHLIKIFDAGPGAICRIKRNVKHGTVGVDIEKKADDIIVVSGDFLCLLGLQRHVDNDFIHPLRFQLIDGILDTLVDALIDHRNQDLVTFQIGIAFYRRRHLGRRMPGQRNRHQPDRLTLLPHQLLRQPVWHIA